ncbi:hypothetical protein POPTR_017G017200v4 [Populus trichocarpa]|uniref:Uncharacterized protein n=1 Tax=Populus trichocarpa TaxID=3694 RepID=A0A2K1X1X6_POPTR|nr:protein ECERIFERUM 16 isoform X1 [Populus trichocarpa]KAI5558033.1 hypothetical protein BDE02_17G012000 [Populus trichocarpa]PNS94783.2 hypothetical protein POPTR_017G017200v4 [Populus trichocarpa]|eukprot:XP_006372766.1 uncharacterized protein LOC18106816 isoform X1 [Populus trichocarpa]
MDTKALAKSKRAHTLQHNKGKKPHPNQNPSKTPSTGNNQKPQKSKLPSNWDRYEDDEEDEFGVNLENPSGDNSKKPSFKDYGDGLALPKSKGADFKYLLDEAKSKPHQVDDFPFLEGFLAEESMHGVGPLLAVRGESILSWIGDDNFVVEDETTSSHEASFLSLNLHALAEQLAKVDVSERLFIEADLLPTELGSNTSSSQEFDQMQTTGSEASSNHGPNRKQTTHDKETKTISGELTFEDFSEKNKAVNQDAEIFVSGLTIGNSDPISFIQGLDVKDNLNLNQHGKSNQRTAMESPAQFYASSVAPNSRLPTFEAAAAESELDMLLDSLSEAKLLDSSGFGSGTLPVSEKEAAVPLPQLTRNAPGSAKTTPTAATLDNVLDDLLEETSNLQEAAAPLPLLARNAHGSLKTTSTAATLDDVLDDLFEETSSLSNQNNLHQPSEKKADHVIQSSSSQSVNKSKVLDDFDSWLDTI